MGTETNRQVKTW